MKRKAVSLVLSLVMCLVLCVPASAADSDFTIENGVLTKYNGPGGDVVIPDSVTNIRGEAFFGCTGLTNVTIPNSVTSIGGNAFRYCTDLTSIIIPHSVTNIWVGAFLDFRGLTSIIIPNSVTSVEPETFYGCTGLTDVTIPDSVTSIGAQAFYGCTNLAGVTIPDSVTSIGSGAFYSCGLTSVTIPSSVTTIGRNVFLNCNKLTDVYYTGAKTQWDAIQIDRINEALTSANIHFNAGQPQQTGAQSATATPTNDKLTVNGALANPTVYKIDGSNYFKIRDVAALLNGTESQFAVGYDSKTNSVTATTGQGYEKLATDLAGAPTGGDQSAESSNDTVYVDGGQIDAQVYKINGSNYFKLRDLGKALNFSVDWSREAGMIIDTSRPYSE